MTAISTVPPELVGNRCRIAPEWENTTKHKFWFVSAPYGGDVLRFKGEPTSLLYAMAPLMGEVESGRIHGVRRDEIALLNPTVASEPLYAEMERRLRAQPDLRAVCISALTASSTEARRIAQLAKRVRPSVITIVGGPHEDDVEVKTAADPDYDGIFDFSVAGDGEYALLELGRLILSHPEATPAQIKSIARGCPAVFRGCEGRGAVYFRDKGESHALMLGGSPPALDGLPLMPRELVHETDTRTFAVFKRHGWNVKTAQIMTHRGCAWRCTFCSESASLNVRSMASLVREIEQIKNFRHAHSDLDREDYGAIFFDDSTFTTHSKRRSAFLNELFGYLRSTGLEWGCQTRLDQMDVETLQAMKEAGCTYVYTGLESASDQMLRAMVKDQGRAEIERAFDAIDRVGIRVGVSLIFGVAEPGLSRTAETLATIHETLEFVERRIKSGNIVFVSPNIATYYPGTRMTAGARKQVDFRNPIVHRGFPWNRFEEGESYHPEGIDELMARFIVEESVKRFGEFLVDQDVLAIPDHQEAYRHNSLARAGIEVTDLNAASISKPLPEAEAVARHVAKYGGAAGAITEEARRWAASLMGLSERETNRIVLARNATDGVALAGWLAGLHQARGSRVLTTNAENLSVSRAMRFHMDHGNPDGRDLWSSFQDFGTCDSGSTLLPKRATGITVDEVDVFGDGCSPAKLILSRMTPETRLVVFSHVIRDNGLILPVGEICMEIRKRWPDALILVDGAQALGALPLVNVAGLGCHFYAAAPHKTVGSLPLGLLYVSEDVWANLRKDPTGAGNQPPESTILGGMFASEHAIPCTTEKQLSLPELAGFSAALETLSRDGLIQGNDCRRLDAHRRALKEVFVSNLRRLEQVDVVSGLDSCYSNFIASFRLKSRDGRDLAESLWRDERIFVSYIARTNLIRVAFGSATTSGQVKLAFNSISRRMRDDSAVLATFPEAATR